MLFFQGNRLVTGGINHCEGIDHCPKSTSGPLRSFHEISRRNMIGSLSPIFIKNLPFKLFVAKV